MTSATMPMIRKESTYFIVAAHDLRGVTQHQDAMAGVHEHVWKITCIWKKPYSPSIGFLRDEAVVDTGWGARIRELEGRNLSEMMKLPATAENFAFWLLLFWLVRLSEHEVNYELDGVRVTKGDHSVEVERSETNKRAWMAHGGEVT
jgi:6-pyruvoyl tetrahydropterin synthase-like protein